MRSSLTVKASKSRPVAGRAGSSSRSSATVGGERFFRNTFEATRDGSVTLAPPLPGYIDHEHLNSETVYVQSGGYIAADNDVDVDAKWGGARTFLGGEGLVCEFEGSGTVWLQTRSQDAFVSWLVPQLPVSESDNGNVQFDVGDVDGFLAAVLFLVAVPVVAVQISNKNAAVLFVLLALVSSRPIRAGGLLAAGALFAQQVVFAIPAVAWIAGSRGRTPRVGGSPSSRGPGSAWSPSRTGSSALSGVPSRRSGAWHSPPVGAGRGRWEAPTSWAGWVENSRCW
ncbi:MAG: hypothetical protein ACI9YT_001465 [Halobacteriales archaeon]|jgi:hypothetical protein